MTITKDPKTCKMFQSCLCGQRNKCKEMHVNEKQAIRKKFEKKRRLIRTTEDGSKQCREFISSSKLRIAYIFFFYFCREKPTRSQNGSNRANINCKMMLVHFSWKIRIFSKDSQINNYFLDRIKSALFQRLSGNRKIARSLCRIS